MTSTTETFVIWIACVLTVWVTIDLGTRYYLYQEAQKVAYELRVAKCVGNKMNEYTTSLRDHYEKECRRTLKR